MRAFVSAGCHVDCRRYTDQEWNLARYIRSIRLTKLYKIVGIGSQGRLLKYMKDRFSGYCSLLYLLFLTTCRPYQLSLPVLPSKVMPKLRVIFPSIVFFLRQHLLSPPLWAPLDRNRQLIYTLNGSNDAVRRKEVPFEVALLPNHAKGLRSKKHLWPFQGYLQPIKKRGREQWVPLSPSV